MEEINILIDNIHFSETVVKRELEWLAQGHNHSLQDSAPLARYLLKKVLELERRIETLENSTITFGEKL